MKHHISWRKREAERERCIGKGRQGRHATSLYLVLKIVRSQRRWEKMTIFDYFHRSLEKQHCKSHFLWSRGRKIVILKGMPIQTVEHNTNRFGLALDYIFFIS